MEANNSQNQSSQSYWFVLQEDQSNVVFSSNNFTIQNRQRPNADTKNIDTSQPQYIQLSKPVETVVSPTASKPEFWDADKIKLLLSLLTGNETGDLKNEKNIWVKISVIINRSPEDCAKKYRILRNTFIRLTKKKRLGRDIKWVYYSICEKTFKNCKTLPPAVFETWEDSKTRKLLSMYIDNMNHFQNSQYQRRDFWKEIAAKLCTTEFNCYHKFRVLKRTYRRISERNRLTGKHIKWPYYSYLEQIFFSKRPGTWVADKIKLLLQAYAQMASKFSNPKFHKKVLWREISDIVGESPANCDRKYRNLKQTYLKLKHRALKGRLNTKWSYYKDFELIERLNQQALERPINHFEEANYIHRLLQFYVENKDIFRKSVKKKLPLWSKISSEIGLSPYECDRKFRNLKQTYVRLSKNKELTGKTTKWPYYSYFEKIYSESEECNTEVMQSDMNRLVQDMQVRKEKDLKFERLIRVAEESNKIQRERNNILKALLDRRK